MAVQNNCLLQFGFSILLPAFVLTVYVKRAYCIVGENTLCIDDSSATPI